MVEIKTQMKKWSKRVAFFLFITLFFLNIKIAFTEDLLSQDISLLGLQIDLTDEISAQQNTQYGYWQYHFRYRACRCEPISLNDVWQCTALWSWSSTCNGMGDPH